MYRLFIVVLLLGLLWACDKKKESADKSEKESPRPNIILIIADDLGWSDLNVYGNTYFESPNIDALARKGVRFDHAYAAAHVCSPTRASILTGKYPAKVGLTNYLYGTKKVDDAPVLPAPFVDRLPLKEKTLAEILKDYGYKTGLIGKWHLGENTSFGESDPKFHGFDVSKGFDYELLPVKDTYKWFKIGDTTTAYELPHLTDEITKNSLKFIASNKDTSFFMTVAHFSVHLPLQTTNTLKAKYEAKANPRPNDYNPTYAGMIEEMDYSVGAIMAALEEHNLMDNTILLFVSDNGGLAVGEAGNKPTVNDPLRSGKGTMYEGGLRVPMIAYWKGNFEGGIVNSSVISTIDILPTLLKIVDPKRKIHGEIDGMERLAAFKSKKRLQRGPLYWHYPHFSNQGGRPKSAILDGDYKLIRSLEDNSLALYNLKNDLGERINLIDDMPEKAQLMSDSLEHWLKKVNAQMPILKEKR